MPDMSSGVNPAHTLHINWIGQPIVPCLPPSPVDPYSHGSYLHQQQQQQHIMPRPPALHGWNNAKSDSDEPLLSSADDRDEHPISSSESEEDGSSHFQTDVEAFQFVQEHVHFHPNIEKVFKQGHKKQPKNLDLRKVILLDSESTMDLYCRTHDG